MKTINIYKRLLSLLSTSPEDFDTISYSNASLMHNKVLSAKALKNALELSIYQLIILKATLNIKLVNGDYITLSFNGESAVMTFASTSKVQYVSYYQFKNNKLQCVVNEAKKVVRSLTIVVFTTSKNGNPVAFVKLNGKRKNITNFLKFHSPFYPTIDTCAIEKSVTQFIALQEHSL